MLTVAGADGTPQNIAVKLSARGHFRRMARNCSLVPLRVEFPKEGMEGTPFEGQTTLKLGTGCEDSKEYEQITLREYLAYPLFNMVTPLAFRARLGARHLHRREIEEEERRATRCSSSTRTKSPAATKAASSNCRASSSTIVDGETLTRVMLFEYMIGNTDMSIWALHNIRLIQKPDRTLIVVPYDFDLSGFVHAPYAIPDRQLGLRSVVDRLYRGPCRTTDEFDAAAAPFRAKRGEMLALVEAMKDLDASRARGSEGISRGVLPDDRQAGLDQEDVRQRLQDRADDVDER